jgi:hypothetical protein
LQARRRQEKRKKSLSGGGGATAPNREASTFYGAGACLLAKKKRHTKGAKSQKIEDSRSPTRELELLKSELASLACKYESLANKYDHDIKSFSYRTKIEEEANETVSNRLPRCICIMQQERAHSRAAKEEVLQQFPIPFAQPAR